MKTLKEKSRQEGTEKYKQRLLKKLEEHRKTIVTEDQVLEMMNEKVFKEIDFNRHLSETAKTLKIPYEHVDSVIKHYLITMAKQMSLITRVRRRLSIYAFFMIEIKDSATDFIVVTEEKYIKKFGKEFTKQILSIFK